MNWGAGIWLLLAPLLALGTTAGLLLARRRQRAILERALPTTLLPSLTASVSPSRRAIKTGLAAFAVLLVALALARPQWGRETTETERAGVDVLIALDVSRSMLAPDVGGTNRLTAARQAVGRLLDRLGGDRVGVIAFAGDAFLAAPLTRDHEAARRALASLDPSAVSAQGSDLSKAIASARAGLERGSEGPRTLLVISDGEQLQGDALSAVRAAATAGLTVHCAAVGSTTGARLPQTPASGVGFVKNAFGRDVVSRMDPRLLQQAASAGRGLYVRIEGTDSHALVDWFDQVSARLPRTTETRGSLDPRERFQWPLALALAVFAAEWGTSDRRRAVARGGRP
jgi:Ca-activated chloride channel family protein